MSESYHTPVLIEESVLGLNLKPNSIVVDATFGGGGHSSRILSVLGPNGKLFAFDQDGAAFVNVPADMRIVQVHSNFRYLTNFLRYYKVHGKVDAILADLGVSSHQFDTTARGFSIHGSAELDMRMNSASKKSAQTVLNTYSEKALETIFRNYADMQNSRRIARIIVERRTHEKLKSTGQLLEWMQPMLPAAPDKRHQFCAQLFQAIRIEVNDECGALSDFLAQVVPALKIGGRVAVISYHSIEDRLVKNIIRNGNLENEFVSDPFGRVTKHLEPITRKPLVPNQMEMNRNPRSRSAKLRIAEKL